MGTNPMQKMKRNSTIIGLVIGLMIGLLLCVGVYFYFSKNPIASSKDNPNNLGQVCVLIKTIKAGSVITYDDVTMKSVSKDVIPSNAVVLK